MAALSTPAHLSAPTTVEHEPTHLDAPTAAPSDLVVRLSDDEGSIVTEYGLVAIIGATAASLLLAFLRGGALTQLFSGVMASVRSMVGI